MEWYKQKQFNFRTTIDTAEKFDEFCERIGTTRSQCIKLFIHQCINMQEFPFEPGMEKFIPQEHTEALITIKMNDEDFIEITDLFKKMKITRKKAINTFMEECIVLNKIPFEITGESNRK